MSHELACFFSGSVGGKHVNRMIDICTHRLLSCHGSYLSVAKKWCSMAHSHPEAKQREIMLDSGAFSAWSKGEETSLEHVVRAYDQIMDRYAAYYGDIWLINLDKIPGERGRTATQQEIVEAIKISDENFAKLTERYGPRVLPVFHQDETPERLREVLAQNEQYICISPRNDVHEKMRREWSQRAHVGLPSSTWTHGLAATGVKMMLDVPWRSVDSASWTTLAGYGKISLCMNGRLFVNNISEDSAFRRMFQDHADHLPELEREPLVAAIEECGMTFEEARRNYDARAWINLYHFQKFTNIHRQRATVSHQQTLFAL